ncbi:hypothetical protein [Methylobacterium nodulans]|uniref:Uncharacterized protein n=1 Tax=Methylobacterium nodulans (strain LMG 21967 / CNCM I-2342 / ORS 2060) TaxID=460265 RepID=B8ITY8_METNO|nr:hypothetical protein [Methylobacterium nodulans]ACL60846.1 conserved hypothetical protein [Methylobacterium nodulans ORS 2060]
MIRTATLIAATAALASYALVAGGRAEPARVAPGKPYTDRLPAASFAPSAQDLALFSLGNAGGETLRVAERPCRAWPFEGASCLADASGPATAQAAPGIARLARLAGGGTVR